MDIWTPWLTWWCHPMESCSASLALRAGNSPVTGEFPTQSPVTRSFDVLFDLRLNNGWVNNRDAGDLRRHRAHYDVTVMAWFYRGLIWNQVKIASVVISLSVQNMSPFIFSTWRRRVFNPTLVPTTWLFPIVYSTCVVLRVMSTYHNSCNHETIITSDNERKC